MDAQKNVQSSNYNVSPHYQSPFISFCIPTYNRAAYLRRCLLSLTSQPGDFEVVISDNASPDATAEVVAENTDPRIRYVRQLTNLGLTGNFIKVVQEARGEYVCVVTDDDFAFPDSARQLREWLLEDRPDVAKCDVIINNEKSRTAKYYGIEAKLEPGSPATILLRQLFTIGAVMTGFCFRRAALDEEFWNLVMPQYYPTYLILGWLGRRPGYLASPLFMHTWENETYWDHEPDYVDRFLKLEDLATALSQTQEILGSHVTSHVATDLMRSRAVTHPALLQLIDGSVLKLRIGSVIKYNARRALKVAFPRVARRLRR